MPSCRLRPDRGNAGFRQSVQDEQRGHDPVAGRVLVEENDMTRIFAAELPAALVQHLEHVTVADFGAGERDKASSERVLRRRRFAIWRPDYAPPRNIPRARRCRAMMDRS